MKTSYHSFLKKVILNKGKVCTFFEEYDVSNTATGTVNDMDGR